MPDTEVYVRKVLDQVYGDDMEEYKPLVQNAIPRVARYVHANELMEAYEPGSDTLDTIIMHLTGFASEGF